ncbi:hypothetical protein C8A00DRAFT_19471 [Chaetomidium leptoderma]|uniref:DUF7136 domain-containing protein n=1 Tax=Chaetomidium leptoderma TaxID=669021 RepID=A0AAN6VC60_9PEZI|nr:hypothetical protein C8A00DRAFT_19471 [Chaetomidium leptoderma]
MNFRAVWSLVASLAFLGGAIVDAAGVLEIDMVFPRDNQTYEPTPYMPIVFALRNAELAQYLRPSISARLLNLSASRADVGHGVMTYPPLEWANFSSQEPYFTYEFQGSRFATEGNWSIFWDVAWGSCKEDEDGVFRGDVVYNHSSTYRINIDIKNGGQVADLVAATANGNSCFNDGVAINVTDQLVNVTNLRHSNPGPPFETCVVVASSTPTPTPDPCLVKIDSAVAASISASLTAKLCNRFNPPSDIDCPPESAAQRLAVAGVVCLAAAVGAFGFILG